MIPFMICPWTLIVEHEANVRDLEILDETKFFAVVVSYNRPNLSSNASWNPIGVTLGNGGFSFPSAYAVFVNTDNTIYTASLGNTDVQVWQSENTFAPNISLGSVHNPYSMFVATNGDIYTSNGPNNRVDRWLLNGTSSLPAMLVYGDCFGLFIDTNNNLYCCVGNLNFVVLMPIGDKTNTLTQVAGQSCAGSASDMLSGPDGIFVDWNFNLYVADWGNNRIQMFPSGQRNGTTVAGWGASGTMDLNHPTDVVLDADSYVFIVDTDNNRIVGSGPNGFRCIIGCSGTTGSAPNQLNSPRTLAFDGFGNIWVADHGNNRFQKFRLDNGSSGKFSRLYVIGGIHRRAR